MGSDCEKPDTVVSLPVNKDPYTSSSGRANLGLIMAGKDPNYTHEEYEYRNPDGSIGTGCLIMYRHKKEGKKV